MAAATGIAGPACASTIDGMSKALRLWLVDDSPIWHSVTASTVEKIGHPIEFSSFHSANAAISAFGQLAEHDPGQLPHVILMDFYIGHDHGNEVTATIRELEPDDHHCTIVGHSSMTHGSELICADGGDCIVRKHRNGANLNLSLQAWLSEYCKSRS